ncbi:MAG: hypothetical protein OEM59_08740 [Rhodospirillales bacterium]|nr:hypothetical protein [Rhodospirillales bacterium]
MQRELEQAIHHDMSEDCPVCKVQDIVQIALVPAAAAWEANNELPRFSVALHGAAALLGAMLEEGVPRGDIEIALTELLDDIEQQIAEDKALGGPAQGSA